MPTGIYRRTKEMYDSRRGKPTWNKGLKGIHLSPKSELKKGENIGKHNNNWKGGISKKKEYASIKKKKRKKKKKSRRS